MAEPYYEDDKVTLFHGDCLEVLQTLPDASVDAVVTDPPYGLEFMGKDWDSFKGDAWRNSAGITRTGYTDGANRISRPAYGGGDSANPTCAACGGRKRGAKKCACAEPEWRVKGKPLDQRQNNAAQMRAFQQWCEEWATECLRVLKPGGHMLAFGGTRTWHRLACAVEDAGFEVRDSIAWLYGSGFPKSLDVSKAIDKAAGAEREVVGFKPRPDGTSRNYEDWAGASGSGATIAREGGDWRPSPDTAPATPDAERWQGWGTALKPAHEPVVCARKPLGAPGVNVLAMVESELRKRLGDKEIRWTSDSASGAARPDPLTSSSSTEAPQAGATSAAPADASETPNDARPTVRSSATSTPHGELPTASTSGSTPSDERANSETKSSTPTAARALAAASESGHSSPSTTSTEAAPSTARRRGARSTTRSSGSDSPTVTESFAGIATGLTGSWATVHIDRLSDGTFVWPDGLPRTTAGGSTVAANVLAHGTGALNIDACRTATSEADKAAINAKHAGMDAATYERRAGVSLNLSANPMPLKPAEAHTAGRWPTNVVLDDSTAAELDRQSGASTSRVGKPRGAEAGDGWGMTATGAEYDDRGGASRFFPTFRYEAKAPAAERPRVNGTAHPTVKPLDLMRWLVRLVTPPGGTVLEPFAGSGTTVEACIVEGFRCIAIEREPDYLPLILQRVHRRRDPVAAIRQTGDDLGLFDLEPPA